MTAVQNSKNFHFPFHAKLKSQPALRVLPLGDHHSRWTVWRRSDYFYPEMIPEPDYSESEASSEEGDDDYHSGSNTRAAIERLRDLEEDEEDKDDMKKRGAPLPLRAGAATSTTKIASSKTASPKREAVTSSSPKRGNPKKIVSETTSPKTARKKAANPTQTSKASPSSRTKNLSSSEEEDLIKPKKPANPYLESSERVQLHKELKFSQKYGKNGGRQRSELQQALEKYTENKLKRDLAACQQTSLEKILKQQAKKIEMQERQNSVEKRPSWMDRLQNQQNLTFTDPKTDEFYRVHARVVNNLMSTSLSSEESCDHSSSPSRISDSSSSDD